MMNLLFLNIGSFGMGLISIPILCFVIYSIYHAINNKRLTSNERIIWILLILVANILGSIAYWLIGKNGSSKN